MFRKGSDRSHGYFGPVGGGGEGFLSCKSFLQGFHIEAS